MCTFFYKQLSILFIIFSTTILCAQSVQVPDQAKLANKAKEAKIALQAKTASGLKMAKLPSLSLASIKALKVVKQHRFVPTKIMEGGSLYLVKGYFDTPQGKQSTSLFLSPDMQTAVYGRGFSTATTKEYKTFTPKQYINDAVFTFGEGKDEYFLFTDPLCPYCKDLEKELYKYKDITTFHVFLLALPMHKNAPLAIDYVLSKSTNTLRYQALIEIAQEKKDYLNFKSTSTLQNQYDVVRTKQDQIAKEFKVRGTPAIYSISGEVVRRKNLEDKLLSLKQKI